MYPSVLKRYISKICQNRIILKGGGTVVFNNIRFRAFLLCFRQYDDFDERIFDSSIVFVVVFVVASCFYYFSLFISWLAMRSDSS